MVKNGRSENGRRRYRRAAMNAAEIFKMNAASCNAWKPGVKEQIETQPLNSSCARDIERNLGISKDTVISELKKTPAEVNPYFMPSSGRS